MLITAGREGQEADSGEKKLTKQTSEMKAQIAVDAPPQEWQVDGEQAF